MHKSLMALFVLAPVAAFAAADALDQKGFVYIKAGETSVLRAEPAADAKEIGRPPAGVRVKHVKRQDGWYLVEVPGMKPGWLADSATAATRPEAPPAGRPVPARNVEKTIASTTALTAAARLLDARAAGTTGNDPETTKRRVVQFAIWEQEIGVQMADVPHPNGLYADVTARGRKADAEKFLAELKESD